MRRTLFLLFLVHLLTRLIFVNIAGPNNNYNLQCDSYWLTKMGDDVTNGDFTFDIGRFIASPLFPTVCGIFKICSPDNWEFYLEFFQIILSSIGGIYIFKICLFLFRNKELSILSSLLYACFPMTMWYVGTFSQETIFQTTLIITIFWIIRSLQSDHIRHTFFAALFFSLAYLTKSHILLFSLFIPLIYFHSNGWTRKTFKKIFVFGSVAFLFSMPFGLFQYFKNGTYVLSSNGAGYQFYLGNTEAGYRTIVNLPEKNSEEFNRMQDITVYAGYFNGCPEKYDQLIHAGQNTKQGLFFKEGIEWIKSHPVKFLKLKLYDAILFLTPGVSFRHYNFMFWLVSFSLSFPIYFFAYKNIYIQNKADLKTHSWILYLVISMFIFSTFWYVQNRFRTITLEPFYIIYASYYLNEILLHFSPGKKFAAFLEFMFVDFPRSVIIKAELRNLFASVRTTADNFLHKRI